MKSKATLLLLIVLSVFSHQIESKRINCRRYVHVPECRGIAAKRDTMSRLNEDYRLEELPNSAADISPITNDNVTGRNLLIALLKRAVERSMEYDGNY